MEQTSTYPGARLGLPDDGPGSVASWLARFGALVLDWAASLGVAAVVSGGRNFETGSLDWYTPLVFLLEASLLTALAGGSFGQLVTRVAVVRLDNSPVTFLTALLRTFLICLVIPPLVFNSDQRGLHDLAAKTITLRR